MSLSLIQRFWNKVEKRDEDQCWPWRGTTLGGYGILRGEGRKMVKAHRFSYEMQCGPIPKGLYVLHRCDNPPCVNPKHLRVGTAKDNMADVGRDRWSAMRKLQWASYSSDRRVRIGDKISQSLTGKKLSAEHKKKLRLAKLGKPAKISDEAKAKKNASIKAAWAAGAYANRGKSPMPEPRPENL